MKRILQEYKSDIFVAIFILIGLYFLYSVNYLLFHVFAELFSVIVGVVMFLIAWNTRKYISNDFLKFVGVSFLFVALFDFFHMLSYKDMGMIPGYDANLPTQFWIIARYFQAFIFLAATSKLVYKQNIERLFVLETIIFSVFALLPFFRLFPDCYVEGEGLTQFKITSEFVIIGILMLSAVIYWRRDETEYKFFKDWILISILFNIFAEYMFTQYGGVFDLSNVIGHFLKFLSMYALYRGVVEGGLKNPFETLFIRLNDKKQQLEEEIRERKKIEAVLKRQATTDDLVGITNRRHFIELTKKEMLRALRFEHEFTIALIDLDNFKGINDTYGHPVGDQILIEFAQVCQNNIREVDIFARYGGDEFILAFPETGLEQAAEIITRIKERLRQSRILVDGQSIQISISVGLSNLRPGFNKIENLITDADLKLYDAKKRRQKDIVSV